MSDLTNGHLGCPRPCPRAPSRLQAHIFRPPRHARAVIGSSLQDCPSLQSATTFLPRNANDECAPRSVRMPHILGEKYIGRGISGVHLGPYYAPNQLRSLLCRRYKWEGDCAVPSNIKTLLKSRQRQPSRRETPCASCTAHLPSLTGQQYPSLTRASLSPDINRADSSGLLQVCSPP